MLKHILGQQKPFGRMQPFRVVFTYSISRVTPGAIHIIALQANGVKTLRIKNFSWYATLPGCIYIFDTTGYTRGYSYHCPSGKWSKDTSGTQNGISQKQFI